MKLKIVKTITETIFGKNNVKILLSEIKERRISLDERVDNILKEYPDGMVSKNGIQKNE